MDYWGRRACQFGHGALRCRLRTDSPKGMTRIPAVTVHKWRALSLQRLAHLSERRRSGRWHLFYASQGAFEEAVRIAAPDTPVPFSTPLEEFFLPKTSDIVAAARKLAAY